MGSEREGSNGESGGEQQLEVGTHSRARVAGEEKDGKTCGVRSSASWQHDVPAASTVSVVWEGRWNAGPEGQA